MLGYAVASGAAFAGWQVWNRKYRRPLKAHQARLSQMRWYQVEQRRLQLEAEYQKEHNEHMKAVEDYAKRFGKRFIQETNRLGLYHRVRDETRENAFQRIQPFEVRNHIIWADGFALELKQPWGINIFSKVIRDDVINHLRLVLNKPDLKFDVDYDLGLFAVAGMAGRNDGIPLVFPWKSSETIFTAMYHLPKHSRYNMPIGMAQNRTYVYYSLVDERQPHMLVAGGTGGGKSVFVNQLICSLLERCTPDDLILYLIDLKGNEFFSYEPLVETGHIGRIEKDPDQALDLLEGLAELMEKRYEKLSKARCRNLHEWNQRYPDKKEKFIIFIVDEMADLSAGKKKRDAIDVLSRLGRKARASGIHMIIATQRPSSEVVAGELKTHFGTTMAFGQRDVHSSIATIGTGAAAKFDNIRGRAIFIDGIDMYEVQAPLIESDQIDRTVAAVIERDKKPPQRISAARCRQMFDGGDADQFWRSFEAAKHEDELLTVEEFVGMVMG